MGFFNGFQPKKEENTRISWENLGYEFLGELQMGVRNCGFVFELFGCFYDMGVRFWRDWCS